MKILLTFFVIFFSSSVFANNLDSISVDELIQVITSNDEICYYTKITKPINEYQEHEEYEGYYFLKTNKTCDLFLEFQNKLHEEFPNKSHLPYSGKTINVDEETLTLTESIYLEGKISEIVSKDILSNVIVKRWIYNNNERINKEYNKDGKIIFKQKWSEVLKSSNQYSNYEQFRYHEIFYYNDNEEIQLNYRENLENNSIELIKNNLESFKYNWKNKDYTYFALKTQQGYILIQLEDYNQAIKFLVKYYDKPPVDSQYIKDIEINSFVNGVKKFFIKDSRIRNTSLPSGSMDFRATLFDQGKSVISYSVMMSNTLTFENTLKNGQQHGVSIHFTNGNEIYSFDCYDNGYDNEIDLEKDLISCESNYLYDLRLSKRDKYFTKELYPKQTLLDHFILLDAFLKLHPR